MLSNWVLKNNLNNPSEDVKTPTHYLFSGGCLYLNKSDEYTFLCHYADAMKNGVKLYYVEKRPDVFRYMIDIDISDDKYWEKENVVELARIIQRVVSSFFDSEIYVICCTSPQKIKNEQIHTGIHLIYPSIFITSEVARMIRLSIIESLKESIVIKNSWDDAIDERVYLKIGYRMVGSDKMIDGVAENRPLSLSFVMNKHGELREKYYERLINDTKALILETSIRNVPETFENCPMKTIKYVECDIECENNVSYSPVTDKDHKIIVNFIKKNLPGPYNKCNIKDVSRYPDNNILIIIESRFCLNIGRSHNSCGVYLFGCPDGIYQKCLCPCNKTNDRKKGLCKNFNSECFKFDDETRTALFPKYVKTRFDVKTEDAFLIKNFIRDNMFDVNYKSIYKLEDDNIIIRTESKLCNGKEHECDCFIYFYVTPLGIYQKCSCKCNEVCKKFTSKCFRFDSETSKRLFPKNHRKIKNSITGVKDDINDMLFKKIME